MRSKTQETFMALPSTQNLIKSEKPDYYPLKAKRGREFM